MPPLPPISGIYRAVMNYTYDGQETANVMHFSHPEYPTPATPADLGQSLINWWAPNIKVRVPATCVLRAVTVTDLAASGPPALEYATGLPIAGTDASPQMPNNVTVAMSLRTALRGRSFRGRLYHVGLPEAQVQNNNVVPASLTSLLGAYNLLVALDSASLGQNYQLVVLSYWANKALRSVPVATPVVSITSEGIIDSQRRRLPGRGR